MVTFDMPHMSNPKPREVAMKVSKAATIWIDYHKAHSKKKHGSIL
jgi:hypothetical protein